jgi:glutamate transport system substrate-binding protein
VETPSKVREEVIEQGKVDFVVATYTINDTRKQRISFAGPYYEAGQDIMVKKDNSAITGPESLKAANAKVCSVTGSTPSENIKKHIDPANLVLFDVYSKCADALKNDQVQAVTTDNVILLGLVDASQGAFKLVGKPFTQEPYGIGIKKGDTKFCEFIHETLTEASSNGGYEKAWKDTAGKVAPDTPTLPSLDTCA